MLAEAVDLNFIQLFMDDKTLEKRILYLETNLAELRDWVDQELGSLQKTTEEDRVAVLETLKRSSTAIEEIKSIVFGNTAFRLLGLLDRIEKIETSVGEIAKDRQSQRDQLKGIQTGLKVVQYIIGALGTGGLGAIIALLSGLGG